MAITTEIDACQKSDRCFVEFEQIDLPNENDVQISLSDFLGSEKKMPFRIWKDVKQRTAGFLSHRSKDTQRFVYYNVFSL